jgi:septal ring factor EnvC (AmiA/AmiB activator)
MSFEAVANAVDIDLNRLPDMEALLEETTKAVARKEVKADILEDRIHSLEEEEKRRIEDRIHSLEEEEKRRKRIVTLSPSSYHYVSDNSLLFCSQTTAFITISVHQDILI